MRENFWNILKINIWIFWKWNKFKFDYSHHKNIKVKDFYNNKKPIVFCNTWTSLNLIMLSSCVKRLEKKNRITKQYLLSRKNKYNSRMLYFTCEANEDTPVFTELYDLHNKTVALSSLHATVKAVESYMKKL